MRARVVDHRKGAKSAAPTARPRETRIAAAWRAPRLPLIEVTGLGLSVVVCLGLVVGLIG